MHVCMYASITDDDGDHGLGRFEENFRGVINMTHTEIGQTYSIHTYIHLSIYEYIHTYIRDVPCDAVFSNTISA